MRGYVKKPPLTWRNAQTIGIVPPTGGVSYLTFGDQAFEVKSPLEASLGKTGLGGMLTGPATANTAYYVYAILSGQTPQLGISLKPPTTGPGLSPWTYVGSFVTDASLNICPFYSVPTWISYTPTGTWTTNVTYTGKYRVVDGIMQAQIRVVCSGIPTDTTLSLIVPGGYQVDASNMFDTSIVIGGVSVVNTGVSYYPGFVYAYPPTPTVVSVQVIPTAGAYGLIAGVARAVPFAFGNTDDVMCFFEVPVVTGDLTDPELFQ